MARLNTLIALVLAFLFIKEVGAQIDWPVYGGDPGGTKYSPLKTINRGNVNRLRIAWTFSTGDPVVPLPGRDKSPAFEATPIVVDGVMYFGTPYGKVFALEAATGKMKWNYDTKIDRNGSYGDFANRGVSTWLDPEKRNELAAAVFIAQALMRGSLLSIPLPDSFARISAGMGRLI